MDKQDNGTDDLLELDERELDAGSPRDVEQEVTDELPSVDNENPDWWKSDGSNGEVY